MSLRSEVISAPALADLLQVENDEALLRDACPATGIAVWSVARNPFFRLAMSDLLYASQPLLSTTGGMPKGRIAKAAVRSMAHNVTHRPRRAQLLVRATGVGLVERDGLSFNRYTDYFTQAAPGGSWAFEDLASWSWPELPRAARVSYTTAAFSVLRVRAHLRTGAAHRDLAHRVVHRAATRAHQLLGWSPGSQRLDWLVRHTARRLAALPLQREVMHRWLAKVRPAVFLVEEGCYGTMAAFNAAAREQGVTVAEFQHGAVTAGHDVYNVAPAVASSAAFRRGLPDVFLGYGSWWNAQFNLPVDKVVIGNPHRETVLASVAPDGSARSRILVLGDGRELQAHLEFCRELSSALPARWEVVFRPHPEERKQVLEMDTATFAGFTLDRQADIYASLAECEGVVAELSTGLFDAVGLARRIFVWDTPKSRFGLPVHPFARVAGARDLAIALQRPGEGSLSREQQDGIWAAGWRARFESFLSKHAVERR